MLTYEIRKSKAPPKPRLPPANGSVISGSRKEILERNLRANWFRVGDVVRFKKPRRNPIFGTIVEIVENPDECTWASSGVPMNIVLEIPKKTPDGVAYGVERVKTNVKKLMYKG